jgi:hypothetical protein
VDVLDSPQLKSIVVLAFVPAYISFVNYQGCKPLDCTVRGEGSTTNPIPTAATSITTSPSITSCRVSPPPPP